MLYMLLCARRLAPSIAQVQPTHLGRSFASFGPCGLIRSRVSDPTKLPRIELAKYIKTYIIYRP